MAYNVVRLDGVLRVECPGGVKRTCGGVAISRRVEREGAKHVDVGRTRHECERGIECTHGIGDASSLPESHAQIDPQPERLLIRQRTVCRRRALLERGEAAVP